MRKEVEKPFAAFIFLQKNRKIPIMRRGIATLPHYFFTRGESMSKKPYTSLTFEKRQIIENMAKKKQTPQRIAEATGVHVATIYREMKRGQTKDGYSAIKAQCEVLR